MIVSQKYWATSMLIKEIPIDVKKIIGGVIDCKSINFLIDIDIYKCTSVRSRLFKEI